MSTAPTSKLSFDANVPEELWQALRPMNKWGMPVPKRLGLFPLLKVAVQAGVRQRTVPEDYWRVASDVEGKYLQALVDCPCGTLNVVALGSDLKHCEGCERWYFFAGTEVLVYASPAPGVN